MPKIFVGGQYVADAPEGTDEETARQIADLHRPPSYIDKGRRILGAIAGAIPQPAPRSTIPSVGGGSVVGLGLKGTMGVLDTIQKGNQDDAQNQLQRQAERDRVMEAEKERQKDIKAHQLKLNNDLAERKLMVTAEQHKADQATERTKVKEAGQTARKEIDAKKPVNLSAGAALVDPTTKQELYYNQPPEQPFNLSPGTSRYPGGGGEPIATAPPQPAALAEGDRLKRIDAFNRANPDKPSEERAMVADIWARTGEVPGGYTAPESVGDAAHVSSTYIDIDPETGRQRRMALMSDGRAVPLGLAPEGYTYQTDAQGNIVALNKNDPQAPQAVPTPAPPANGAEPLKGGLPAGSMTDAQYNSAYDSIYKIKSENDWMMWDEEKQGKLTPEMKHAQVVADLAARGITKPGETAQPAPAPAAKRPGQFTGKDGKEYIDNGDGTATVVE